MKMVSKRHTSDSKHFPLSFFLWVLILLCFQFPPFFILSYLFLTVLHSVVSTSRFCHSFSDVLSVWIPSYARRPSIVCHAVSLPFIMSLTYILQLLLQSYCTLNMQLNKIDFITMLPFFFKADYEENCCHNLAFFS